MGTVISHHGVLLYDHDEKKLEKKYDEEEMWKLFKEKYIKTLNIQKKVMITVLLMRTHITVVLISQMKKQLAFFVEWDGTL